MSTRMKLAAAVLAGMALAGGTVSAQTPGKMGDCPKNAVERVDGEVVKVDAAQNKLSVKGADGVVHEFQVSKETLAAAKVGDKIEARLRMSENCKKG